MTLVPCLTLKPEPVKPELEPCPKMEVLLPTSMIPHPESMPLIRTIVLAVPETVAFRAAKEVTVVPPAPPVVPASKPAS